MASPVDFGTIFFVQPMGNLGQQLIAALQDGKNQEIDNILRNPHINLISVEDLGRAFIICVQQTHFGKIFHLPNLQQIPANGQWGLGHALLKAVETQNHDSLRLIQDLPSYNAIGANGTWGLGQALKDCIQKLLQQRSMLDLPSPDPEFFHAIVEHPHANQIQFENELSDAIGKLLVLITIQSNGKVHYQYDQRVVHALLHPQISHLLQPNGQFGLGRVLLNAAYATSPFIVNLILNHSGIFLINSVLTNINEPTKFEEDNKLDCFGFTEAIFAAVSKQGSDLQVQKQVVQSLFNFANKHAINLYIEGHWGLGVCLTNAVTDNESLVPILLNYPGSNTISAGVLGVALMWSAIKGHIAAMQRILQHPNAHQISQEAHRSTRKIAQQGGYANAADLI